MKQYSSTIDLVVRAFHLSEGECRFLLTCNPGEGLYFSELSHVPLRAVASPSEHKIATTNAQELLKVERDALAREKEVSTIQENDLVALQRSRDEYGVVFPASYNPE